VSVNGIKLKTGNTAEEFNNPVTADMWISNGYNTGVVKLVDEDDSFEFVTPEAIVARMKSI
jgi:hypothetical protein